MHPFLAGMTGRNGISQDPPRTVSPPLDPRPLDGQLANFETSGSPSDSIPARTAAAPVPAKGPDESGRPWGLIAALVGSVAGMLYFGWSAFDYRLRYQKLLRQLIEAGQIPVTLGTLTDAMEV